MEKTIISLIDLIFQIFAFLILARVLISWVRVDPAHPAVQFLYDVTEPILRPIRDMMPNMGMFDFSPIIALLLLQIVLEPIVKRIIMVLIP